MNFSLDQFVDQVRNAASAEQYPALQAYCLKHLDALGNFRNNLNDMIASMNIQEHSIGLLTILCFKLNAANQLDEALLESVEDFIVNCNPQQVCYAQDLMGTLCHKYVQILTNNRIPLRGLHHLKIAIGKTQTHPAQFTSIHSDLAQLSIAAKCFKPVLELLDIDVNEISSERSSMDVRHFLQYYYFGGVIYAALKNFERALYFFEVVLTTPSQCVSTIMVEAYRKFILVSLIHLGQVPALPKYTSPVVQRHIKPNCEPYTELAAAYFTHSLQELSVVIARYQEPYTLDNNFGLVKQCVESLHKANIKRLTKTFLTLSLSDMADKIQVANAKEAEKYVLKMIKDGEIFATINQKDGMVIFKDNPEKYNTGITLKKIENDMNLCIQLNQKVAKLDQEVCKNPKYLQKIRISDE